MQLPSSGSAMVSKKLGGAIRDSRHSRLARTIGTAVDSTTCLDPVADHLAVAMRTPRRKRVNRTFKAVENMLFAVDSDRKAFIVIVPTYLTACHCLILLL